MYINRTDRLSRTPTRTKKTTSRGQDNNENSFAETIESVFGVDSVEITDPEKERRKKQNLHQKESGKDDQSTASEKKSDGGVDITA